MYNNVKKLCESNSKFFNKENSEIGRKIVDHSTKIIENLEKSQPVIEEIESFASDYDFDENTPGNGYRSYIFIFNEAVTHVEKICRNIEKKRNSFLFSKNTSAKEIAVCSQMIESFHQIGEGLIEIHKIADTGKLYAKSCHHDNVITRAMKVINQECFYGRSMAFQYCEALRPSMRLVATSMACFSEFYYSRKNIFTKTFDLALKSTKYFSDPELCAQRVCDINKNADIHFLSSFLRLVESRPLQTFIEYAGHGVEVNRTFEIETHPMEIFSEKLGRTVEVPVPMSHIGKKPIQCRIICARRRMDMIGEELDCTKLSFSDPSDCLIVHAHGGGWIAQSSKSHEIYLREWSVHLDVPILSIDYSLAPEAPFPRAIEEIFYAYCWALRNIELLGSTGRKIVFVGDSAGGNIITGCLIRCIEMGITLPTGLFNAYGIYLVNLVKTPSRFMGLFDSFLPIGLIMKIFKSYGCGKPVENVTNKKSSEKLRTEGDIPPASEEEFIYEIPKNYLLSPYWAPDEILKQFPRTKIVSLVTDPCIDDCVEFGKKLKDLNVDVTMKILGNLVHGFLSFTQVSNEAWKGSMECMRQIADLFDIEI